MCTSWRLLVADYLKRERLVTGLLVAATVNWQSQVVTDWSMAHGPGVGYDRHSQADSGELRCVSGVRYCPEKVRKREKRSDVTA